MRIGEIQCKSILGRSGIGGMDYAVNPYLGCSHACAYCYARFMRKMSHTGEDWGDFVDVKVNAVDVLKLEAARKPRGRVILSSVTDAYQPLERKYQLTRRCLEVLLEHGFSVDILTKSDLVLRDIDLFKKFDDIEVGLTITGFDDGVRMAFEPGASSIKTRLDTLKLLNNEGIPTYAFLGPMLPHLSDEHLEELLNTLTDRVSRLLVDRLNIKCGNMPDIRRVLDTYFPDLKSMFEATLGCDSEYYTELKAKISLLCRDRAIPVRVIY